MPLDRTYFTNRTERMSNATRYEERIGEAEFNRKYAELIRKDKERRKKVDVSKWRKMMKPRYDQIERLAQEKTALRRHVDMKLRYGNEGPVAAKKIQESFKNYMKLKMKQQEKDAKEKDIASRKIQKAFKSFMTDVKELKKKRDARHAKELNNLLANYLKPKPKPKLKRERNSKNNNANRGPTKRIRVKK